MTLIAAFKCGQSSVLCADSQETRGPLKTFINKLPIYTARTGMHVVCSGAGNGELTDAFRLRLVDALVGSDICGESAIREQIEAALVGFHESDVYRAFPGKVSDKYIAGLIAVRSAQREVFLYKYFSSVVQPVHTYQLVGEDYAHFENVAKRRYHSKMSINQAVLLGLDVIYLAKATSIGIGGPTRVVIASPDRISAEDNERVDWAEGHVRAQNELIDALRLDLSSTENQLEDKLRAFSNSITAVRSVYGAKYPDWHGPTHQAAYHVSNSVDSNGMVGQSGAASPSARNSR